MLDEKFQRVENEYHRLVKMFKAKSVSAEQFDAALKELMFEHDGRYWIIGASSGKWYAHDNGKWVEAVPPSVGSAPNAASIPAPINQFNLVATNQINAPFKMIIEDVFQITGRGTIVTGTVGWGSVSVGDAVELIGLTGSRTNTIVTGIEKFRQVLHTAKAGDAVGCILQGVSRHGVERGMLLAAPCSVVETATELECEMYLLKTEEGGRKSPLPDGYSLDVLINLRDIPCGLYFPSGTKLVAPGETKKIIVRMITTAVLAKGERVLFREKGRTIGAGTVTALLSPQIRR